jgi:hypothetical protein
MRSGHRLPSGDGFDVEPSRIVVAIDADLALLWEFDDRAAVADTDA